MTMNKIFNKQYLLATALFVAMGVMTGCGDDDSVPAPEQTQKENNSSSNESNNQQQEQIPEVKVIESSAIEENAEEGDVSVRMAEQSGGRAVLIASIAETKAASQIQIVGTYDNEKGCYTFNLSTLETGINYQYIISVFNQKGQKVMESKPKSLTIPESADIDKDGSDGGADGMKGGAVIVKD